jgi:DNA-directed RNA polymerase subunit RPC12/RpoP
VVVSAKDNQTARCKECQYKYKYNIKETKIIRCIDCGKEVVVSARDNQTKRCKECYKKYRIIKNREKALRYYYKSKK